MSDTSKQLAGRIESSPEEAMLDLSNDEIVIDLRDGNQTQYSAPKLELVADPVDYGASNRSRVKRAIDIVGATVGLIVLGPVMALTFIAVKVTSKGPALFVQSRVGLGGEMIDVCKFRSMYVDAEHRLASDTELHRSYVANDFKLESAEDPRVTRTGRFLRSTSLDELPQFLNVLRGEMSLVGPRPVVPDELDSYGQHKAAYLALRPGLTGPWQSGGRNAVRYPERAELDAHYAEHWSVMTDFRIMLATIPAVLGRKNVA